jgi:hypothetical protein
VLHLEVRQFHAIVVITHVLVVPGIDAILIFVLVIHHHFVTDFAILVHLHDLFEDLLRMHTHLLSQLENLRVELIVVDVIDINFFILAIIFLLLVMMVVMVARGAGFTLHIHGQFLLLLFVICKELFIHLQFIVVHGLIIIVLNVLMILGEALLL